MSSIRSCGSSIPAEILTSPSVKPIFARCSAGTDACVIDAGWEMSVSTPDAPADLERGVRRSGVEREHSAEPAHLTLRQRVLGV